MKAKEITKLTKKNLKDAKIISEDLNSMYKDVEKTKNKYKKSFLDWEDAKDNYMKAEKEGILSRKEITKLKSLSNSRNAQCEDYKGVYASQLVKTNKYQEKYYYKDLEKTKTKYKKSFLDWEDAKDSYMKAENDGILSRKEITKLKSLSNSRNAQCEDYKGVYASQLVKTNKYQAKYYYKDLPGVINSLQNIEIDRIEYFKHAMDQCVAAEKQVAPIIDKCREDMENLILTIDPVADSCIIITR